MARFVLLGLVGVGKGTQAKRLSARLGLAHLATGDLLRRHQEEGTELGLLAKGYMERGELLPDDVVIRMVLGELEKEACRPGCIFDGFPRTVEQALALDRAVGPEGVRKVLYLQVPEEVLLRRLSGRLVCRRCQTPYHRESAPPRVEGKCDVCRGELYQRADDRPEVVGRRLQVQQEELVPLLNYYARQGKLLRVNGDLGMEAVEEAILAALGLLAPRG
ncbi:MAG: nucleoside monophosphate kinase [Chloroflexi bacterium]|nr:nucleoside monophosphate kinase [Chloroflexota bacterium]